MFKKSVHRTHINTNILLGFFIQPITFLLIVFLTSCGALTSEEKKEPEDENKFELKNNFKDFSKTLSDNDSIKFMFDLSVCTSVSNASFVFEKNDKQIIWKGYFSDEFMDTIAYLKHPIEDFSLDASLAQSINYYFTEVSKDTLRYHFRPDLTITNKSDTLFYVNKGNLIDKLKFLANFNKSFKPYLGEIGLVETPQK